MPRPLKDQVIVITGASSGIGRETALRAGRAGAAVVLAARNEQALREAAEEIRASGGRALAVVADVADFAQVRGLAERAVEGFGRIDTWVNNAAITLYGTVEQTTPEEFDRVMRVNFLGTVHGCKAAIEQMHRRGGGTIINVASVESERAFPLQGAYTASKHAVKALTETLRMEMGRNRTGIEVVQVNPAGINTPFFEHGRSKVGALPMPAPPIYEPDLVADVILHCAARPRRLAYAGGAAAMFGLLQRISPSLVDRILLMNDTGFQKQVTGEPDIGVDNLDGPMDVSTYRARGRFGDQSLKDDPYTRAFEMNPAVGLAVLGGVALGAVALAAALSGPGRRTIASSAGMRGPESLDRTRRAIRRGARDASRWASHRTREAAGRWASQEAADAARRQARGAIDHVG